MLTMAFCGIYLFLNVTVQLGMRRLQAFGCLLRRTDIGPRSLTFNRRYLKAEPFEIT
jgi:hypothetical protein